MGLFEDLGRKVGRLQQHVEDAADGEASHVCGACGERFYTDWEACPECGEDEVEPVAN